jgi:hypothetical protein
VRHRTINDHRNGDLVSFKGMLDRTFSQDVSRSYSPCEPIQNQTMESPSFTPSARWERLIRTE